MTRQPVERNFPSVVRRSPVRRAPTFRGPTNPVDTGVQAAAAAANFIPGVGQIISAVLSVGDAIFGGGDPTALSVLISQMVGLRQQIAQAHAALGVSDSFVVPSNFNPTDKGKTNPGFVDSIVEEVLGVTEPQIQSNRRADYYSAITALKSELSGLANQAHDQQLTSNVISQLTAALSAVQPVSNPLVQDQSPAGTITVPVNGVNTNVVPVDDNTPLPAGSQTVTDGTGNVYLVVQPNGSNVAPATDNSTLWIIGGAAAILAVVFLSKD